MSQQDAAAERSAHVTRAPAAEATRMTHLVVVALSDGSERSWQARVPDGLEAVGVELRPIKGRGG